jgi:hypothetical protein
LQLEPIELSSTANPYKIRDKSLRCLREATIIPFLNSEMQAVLEFAESILSKAPLIERLTIRIEMNNCEVSKWN